MIVIDLNVVLSALIKDSTTRQIITSSNEDFCFPEASLHKIRKYKVLILEKSGLKEKEYLILLASLFQFIRLVSSEELKLHWDRAKKIIGHIDPEDVPFIAAALSEGAAIWSDDMHFGQQDKIRILKTDEMVRLFK